MRSGCHAAWLPVLAVVMVLNACAYAAVELEPNDTFSEANVFTASDTFVQAELSQPSVDVLPDFFFRSYLSPEEVNQYYLSRLTAGESFAAAIDASASGGGYDYGSAG